MILQTQPGIMLMSTAKGVEIITINNIYRIEAVSNYSKLFFANGRTLVVTKGLKFFEEKLPAAQFIRIHRTHIINKSCIERYLPGKPLRVRLRSGEQITVSKRKRTYFLRSLFSAL